MNFNRFNDNIRVINGKSYGKLHGVWVDDAKKKMEENVISNLAL